MKNAMAATASRTVWLSRLLAVAVALMLGATVVPGVDASKKGKNTIASIDKRVDAQRDICELIGGGALEVTTLPSGTKITYCKGGTEDGKRCKNTKTETTCRQTVTAPFQSGPAAPPTDGIAEEPPGGGPITGDVGVDPGGEADPNSGEPEPPTIQ